MDDLDLVVALRREHPVAYAQASTHTKHLPTLARIAKNRQLFQKFHAKSGKKYDNILLAADEQARSPDTIMIEITDIGLFAVYTHEEYQDFLEYLRENADGPITCDLYQIVLQNQTRKFVFACKDESKRDTLIKHAKACFGVTSTHISAGSIGVQICVSTPSPNLLDDYRKLYNYMLQMDPGLLTDMSPVLEFVAREHTGVRYSVIDHLTGIKDELRQIRRDYRAPAINIVNSTVTNSAISAGSGSAKVKQQKSAKLNPVAAKFISANPPHDEELVRDYYNRFTAATGSKLYIGDFGKAVKAAGFGSNRGTDGRKWIRQ